MKYRLLSIFTSLTIILSCSNKADVTINGIPNEFKDNNNNSNNNSQNTLTFSVNNSYIEVSDTTVPSGSSISLKLIIKDESNIAVPYKGLNVTFFYFGGTSTGSISSVTDNSDGTYSASFTGVQIGTPIIIGGTINGEDLLSTLPEISITIGSAYALSIENAANGLGTKINTASLNDSQSIAVYAVSRDINGNFVANESVTWEDTANMGEFDNSVSTNSVFYPSLAEGSTKITATHATLTAAQTGNIDINWSDMVGSWRMEDNFIDESLQGNDGTNGGATFVAGKKNKGANYTATAYTAINDDSTLDLSTQGSISAWINMTTYAVGGGIVHKGERTDFGDEAYTLQLWNNNKVYFSVVNDSGQNKELFTTSTLATGQWYHLVASWDASGMYFYLNGVLDNSSTNVITAKNSSGKLIIGSQLIDFYDGTSKNFPFDGIIDEVTVWDKALTLSEVQYMYNNGNAR